MRTLSLVALLSALLVLGGCFATSESVYLPDGTSGYRLSCNVGINDIADCMKKAGELCGPNGYNTFDQSGHMRSDADQNQIVIAALNGGTRGYARTTDNQKFMLVKCKPVPPITANSVVSGPLRLDPAPSDATVPVSAPSSPNQGTPSQAAKPAPSSVTIQSPVRLDGKKP